MAIATNCITVVRSVDGKGWKALLPNSFKALNDEEVFHSSAAAVKAARKEYPDTKILIDDRKAKRLGNGLVIRVGDYAPQEAQA